MNLIRCSAPKAGSVIMEPIMSVEVVTPEENMGDVIGDLNKRRGQITGMAVSYTHLDVYKRQVRNGGRRRSRARRAPARP